MCGGQFITEKRVDQTTAAAATTAASSGESKPLDAQQQAAQAAPAASHASAAAVAGATAPAQGQQARATKRRARNDSTGSRESVPPGAGRGDEASAGASGHTRSSGRSQRRPPGRPRKISRSADPETGIFVHIYSL